MSYALFLLAFLATSQGSLQADFAAFPNRAVHRRHLIHERQAPCFNDLNTGQPQSCIATASCCRGVQYSTCVINGRVCCDFGDSMGSCPAGFQCLKNAFGEPSCQPPNTGGGGGGGGDGDGSDEIETEESSTTSEEIESTTTTTSEEIESTTTSEDSTMSIFVDSSTTESETTTTTTTSIDTTTSSSEFYSSYPTTTSSDVFSTSYNPFDQTTTVDEQSEVASPTTTNTNGVTEQDDSGPSTLTQAKLAGIIVSIVAALCGIVFGIVRLIMNHKKHKKEAAQRRLLY